MVIVHRCKQWFSWVPILGVLLPIYAPQASGVELLDSGNPGSQAPIVQSHLQAKSNQSVWQRRPRRPLTIRTGAICPISPGLIQNLNIWSDRPLFIWQGMGSQVRVRNHKPDDPTQVLWEQAITTQDPMRYEGQTVLQPDQLYQWQVVPVDPEASNATTQNRTTQKGIWTTFRVLPTEQRQAIATALGTLEQKLQQQNASAEDITLSKAEFFMDRNLWSDAVQVLYEVSNPSAGFVEQRSAYIAALCKPSTP